MDLRTVRKQKRISQAELAEQVGVSQSMISAIEKGRIRVSERLGTEIAMVLDADPYQLFPRSSRRTNGSVEWAGRCCRLRDLPEDAWVVDCSNPPQNHLLRHTLRLLMRDLRPKERTVLTMRFGLDGKDPLLLEEVGAAVGVTRERVRQIEHSALIKLRHPRRSKRLRMFL